MINKYNIPPYFYDHEGFINLKGVLSKGFKDEYFAIFLCQEGSCDIELENKDYHVVPGHFFVYLPNRDLKMKDMSNDMQGLLYFCNRTEMQNLLLSMRNLGNMFYITQHPMIELNDSQYRFMEQMMRCLIKKKSLVMQMPREGSFELDASISQRVVQSLIDALGFEIIEIYNSHQPTTEPQSARKEVIFQKFILDLVKNFKTEREVIYYAKLQCLTPRYFSNVIKIYSGKSAQTWIIEMVIEEMKKFLETSDKSVKDISYEFNFPNQSFFCRYFKQYTGKSPKMWRKENH